MIKCSRSNNPREYREPRGRCCPLHAMAASKCRCVVLCRSRIGLSSKSVCVLQQTEMPGLLNTPGVHSRLSVVYRSVVKYGGQGQSCQVITLSQAPRKISFNFFHFFTLRAKLSRAVYCYRSCLFVGLLVCLWDCYRDDSKLRASILTKLGL